MRITGGFLKGLKLYGPSSKSLEIRPLRSRIRKTLFDLLGNDLFGYRVLDLFAGTGALGIEALSRGAEFVVFVDVNFESIKIIQKNLEKTGLKEKAKIFKLKLPEGLKKLIKVVEFSFNLVFITPPYSISLKESLALKTLKKFPKEILFKKAFLVIEEKTGLELPKEVNFFQLLEKRIYGETTLWFYKN